jgi:KDO2-lipid IV(A) lauroyltransferase
MDYFLFLIYKFFKFIVLLFPKFLVKIFLDGLSYFIYIINIEHKRYAKANLDLVYKDKISEDRKKEIIKNSYKNLVYNLYEFIENPTLNLEQLEEKITVENESVVLDAIKNNKKIILISAHYGNWEYITSYISLKYKPTTMVGRPMNNKYFNKDMINNRNKHNSEMLNKKGSAVGLMRALKKNRMIGLAIDQYVSKNKGQIVEFLGQKTYMTDSTSRIALKTGAVILPVYFIRDDFRTYTVKFVEPIESKGTIAELTQLQADSISKQIFDKPDDWFWQHKRFKSNNNDVYNC